MNALDGKIFSVWNFGTSVPLLLSAVAAVLLFKWYNQNKRLPPGPWGLPIIGCLSMWGKDPFEELEKFRKKYGKIFSLHLGPNLMVVINDYETLREVLSNPNTLDRPLSLFDFLHNMGFGGSLNGNEWQEQRRFTRYLTRDLGLGKSQWEDITQAEADQFVQGLKASDGKPVDISSKLHETLLSNILSFLVGRSHQKADVRNEMKLLLKYSQLALSEISPTLIVNTFPFLRKILEVFRISDYFDKKKLVFDFFDFLRNEVEKHNNKPEYKGIHDFINVYQEKKKELTSQKKAHHFTDHNLLGNLNSLFLGGADTTFSSLQWLIRLMAKYPDVQRQVYEELMDNIGDGGKISYEKRAMIPYTFAVMMESQRFSSIVPLQAPRTATQDIQIGEYTIPKGTLLSGIIRAIHFDRRYFDEPEKFNPRRFLSDDNKILTNKESFIPFSIGKRNCPGEMIAWMEILVFFTTIVRTFEITAIPGEALDFVMKPGLVYYLKPQALCFKERKRN